MRAARSMKWAATAAAIAVAATACGSGDNGDSDGNKPDGYVSIFHGEPQRALLPSNTNESFGGYVVENVFSTLVDYNEKGKLQNANAESVETDDSKTWTIKLKKGWKFHNGEDVTAESYVKAWNWYANVKNNQSNSAWFEQIKGYEDVHPEKGDPKKDEMEGLKVVDDHTFTVELSEKVSYFNYMLGYSTFAPVPEAFYKDPKAFGQKPIGNGPYKFEKWNHNKLIQVAAWDGYKGSDKPKNKGIQFKNYSTIEGAYQDVLSGNLDAADQVGPKDRPKRKQDFGNRSIDKPYAGNTTIAPAFYAKPFKDVDPKVIQGLSMAIDRDTITKTVLDGTAVPAKSFVPANVEGFKALDTDVLSYNPKKAKQLIKEGGGVPGNKIWIQYNADGGHKEWVTSVCDSIRKATGVECVGDSKPSFESDLKERDADNVKGTYRAGWMGDYPLNINFLRDLYRTGADANYGRFSDKEVDGLFKDGDKAADLDSAVKDYQKAEEKLLQEMPAIPLWDMTASIVHSENVKNVKANWDGHILLRDVIAK
ncbi:peptide ABC transporter substrate-binding protein [Streptomyces xiaopingdaonensis]|uniref:peptide ABC transporter substrate-binding protein n=1 Tax=Streptomyces xiaopingdaonensis TaxID=1565415 RepID=UPI0002D4D37D|nr:ABC transporter substrate-binding protein [Streptomyces xiaopingdaonensis]